MRARLPDLVSVYTEGGRHAARGAEEIRWEDIDLRVTPGGDGALSVRISAERSALRYARLRWNFSGAEKRVRPVRVLGDEWERGYGRMEWRGVVPDRCMPWVALVSDGSDAESRTEGRLTESFGVKARPGALCFWQYDPEGVTLWLDLRNGGSGVLLNGRTLQACEIVFGEYRDMSAFRAAKKAYERLAPRKLALPGPVYGGNTWYYSYGDLTHEGIIEATRLLTDLCEGPVKPYMVVDDGWSVNREDGPWDRGGGRCPDMAALARAIEGLGAIPGIWFRPLSDAARGTKGLPGEARLSRDTRYLDPSHPATLALTRADVERFVKEWGYRLIKHDFTNCDIFGYWGFQRETTITDDGWHFYDRSRTSAEIVSDYYRLICDAAGEETVLIGCNASGHLIAGLAHLNRTGDDTSGIEWERTRRYGVNTLAFRQAHGAFFAPDADCVGVRGDIPWALNREWLRAVAQSGTPLFVSVKPGVCGEEEKRDLREALARAARQTDTLEPLDWMENTCPDRWLLNGEETRYEWYPAEGAESFRP